MAKEIRDYQQSAVDAFKTWYQDKSPIERYGSFLMATGSGKTFTAALAIKELVESGKKVLWLTNKRTLVEQSYNKIREELPDARMGLEWADYHASAYNNVVVASVPSLRGDRLNKMLSVFKPDLIINDEAHHAKGKMWRSILDHKSLENVKCLNLTATPYTTRLKWIDLGTILSHVTTEEGIKRGFLTPIITPQKIGVDLEGVSIDKGTGDYKIDELSRIMTKEEVIEASADICAQYKDRKNLVFCTSKEHAAKTAEILRERGMTVREMYGETDLETRFTYQEELRKGEVNAIVSVCTISEGFDLPEADMVTMLRPTRSPGFYTQMLGRGLRKAEGKENCVLIDLYDKPKVLQDKDQKFIPTEEDIIRKRGMRMDPSIGIVRAFFEGFKDEVSGDTVDTYDKVVDILGLHMRNTRIKSYKEKGVEDKTYKTFYGSDKAARKVLESYVRDVLKMESVSELVKTMYDYGYKYTPCPYVPKGQTVGGREEDLETKSDVISGRIRHLHLDAIKKYNSSKVVTHEIEGVVTNWIAGDFGDFNFLKAHKNGGVEVFVKPKCSEQIFKAYIQGGRLKDLNIISDTDFIAEAPSYIVSSGMRARKASNAQINLLADLMGERAKDIRKLAWSKAEASAVISEYLHKDAKACMEYWSKTYLLAPTKQAREATIVNGAASLRKQKFIVYEHVLNTTRKLYPNMSEEELKNTTVSYCKENIKELLPLAETKEMDKYMTIFPITPTYSIENSRR